MHIKYVWAKLANGFVVHPRDPGSNLVTDRVKLRNNMLFPKSTNVKFNSNKRHKKYIIVFVYLGK